jgi:hypothetical protein
MKVFISHSSVDKKFVQRLATDLRTLAGIDAWLAPWEIIPGDPIPQKLEEGIFLSEVFLLVLSPNSVNSTWVEYERQAWLMRQIEDETRSRQESRLPKLRLIPILYQDCHKPMFLNLIHHIKITDEDYEDEFKLLVSAIRKETIKPPLKGETVEEIKLNILPEPSVSRRTYVFTLLKSLLSPQFTEVIFLYEMPNAYLPPNASQAEKAILLIEYAVQKEGENIPTLLNTIYRVVPHLKGGFR